MRATTVADLATRSKGWLPVTACLVLAFTACGGGPGAARRLPADPPPVVEPLAAPILFTPSEGASSFNEPVAPGPDHPWVETLAAVVEARASAGVAVERDPRLDLASAEIAGVVARGTSVSDGLVEFTLHARGVVEPAVVAFASRATSADELGAELDARLEDAMLTRDLRIGVGGDDPTVVIVVRAALADIGRVPRFVGKDDGFDLDIAVAPGPSTEVKVVRGDRVTEMLASSVDEHGRVRARFSCGGWTGVKWLVVEGRIDPQPFPLALVPIHCGLAPPAGYWTEADRNVATDDREQRLLAVINRERLARGLRPLVTDPRAAAAARRHALAMRATRNVAHDHDGITPSDRLCDEGLFAPRLLESTLRARHLGEVTERLLNDGRYRAQVLDPAATHVGAGIAADRDALHVVIVYVQIPPAIDPLAFERVVRAQVRVYPDASPWLRFDGGMAEVARRYAEALALGWNEASVIALMRDEIQMSTFRPVRQRRWSTLLVVDPTQIDLAAMLDGRPFDTVGVGVAQSARDGMLAGRIWVVALYACEVRPQRNSRLRRHAPAPPWPPCIGQAPKPPREQASPAAPLAAAADTRAASPREAPRGTGTTVTSSCPSLGFGR